VKKIILMLIVIIIVESIVLMYISNQQADSNICGTYILGEEENIEAVYYTFEKNGNFSVYSQGDKKVSGGYKCENVGEGGAAVKTEEPLEDCIFYIVDGGLVCIIDGELAFLKKISNYPMYINVVE